MNMNGRGTGGNGGGGGGSGGGNHMRAQAQAQAQAAQDLSDIQSLKKHPAFERYLLRRLREKRDALAQRVLIEDAATPDQREIWRQLYLEYKALCTMADVDEANAAKWLGE